MIMLYKYIYFIALKSRLPKIFHSFCLCSDDATQQPPTAPLMIEGIVTTLLYPRLHHNSNKSNHRYWLPVILGPGLHYSGLVIWSHQLTYWSPNWKQHPNNSLRMIESILSTLLIVAWPPRPFTKGQGGQTNLYASHLSQYLHFCVYNAYRSDRLVSSPLEAPGTIIGHLSSQHHGTGPGIGTWWHHSGVTMIFVGLVLYATLLLTQERVRKEMNYLGVLVVSFGTRKMVQLMV